MQVNFNANFETLKNIDKAINAGVLRPSFKIIENEIQEEFWKVFNNFRSDRKWAPNSRKYIFTDPLKNVPFPMWRTGQLRNTLIGLKGPGLRVRRGDNYLTIRRAGTKLNYLNFSLRGSKVKSERKIPIRDPFATLITRKGQIKKLWKDRWEKLLAHNMSLYIMERFEVALTRPRRRTTRRS